MSRKIRKHTIKLAHLKIAVEIWYSKTMSIQQMDEVLNTKFPDIFKDMESTNLKDCAALTVPKTEKTPIIIMLNNETTSFQIAHECIHITTQIFNHIGENHSLDNDEFFAYTFTSIFEDVSKVVEEKFKNPVKDKKEG